MPPTGLLDRLKAVKDYYHGVDEIEVPTIGADLAALLLIGYTLVYVLPFYVSATTRPSPTLSRDAPSVIRGRIRAVSISCFICSLTTFIIFCSAQHGTPLRALHVLGYWPAGIGETVKSVTLTAILFLGPLYEDGIVDGAWKDWIRFRGVNQVISGWIGWRNFVAGPVTEEILFRSASVPLFLLAHTSLKTTVFLTPVIFGLAHAHHFYEFRISHPHTPLPAAILRTVFQLSYTTLFGAYATFLYIRTGSLLAVTFVHAFCNWQGLPRVWGRLEGPETLIGPDLGADSKRREDKASIQVGNGRLNILWTVAYYVLLVVGAVSWWKCLWVLTESSNALSKF